MSYCRIGRDSDVYVYPADRGLVCNMCSMTGNGTDTIASSPLSMISHLNAHLLRGDKVPWEAFERLFREAEERWRERLPLGVRVALDRLDALPNQWRARTQPNTIFADELDVVLVDLNLALREWEDQ